VSERVRVTVIDKTVSRYLLRALCQHLPTSERVLTFFKVVSANLTLSTLSAAIRAAGGPQYSFTDVVPVDDQDGGQPGGNIRTAYLYKPELIRLYKPNPGGSLDANEVLDGPTLKYNPGRIDPTNPAWTASRKPLVAQWEVISSKSSNKKEDIFFTVNVHFASKGGSSSLHGDARPPVNGGVQDRTAQSVLTANFVKVCTPSPRCMRDGVGRVR
jgi:predicted extracellular nuclease